MILETHLEAVIEQGLPRTWRLAIDGAPGADTLFISYLSCCQGNMTE